MPIVEIEDEKTSEPIQSIPKREWLKREIQRTPEDDREKKMKLFWDYFINTVILIGVFVGVSYCARNLKAVPPQKTVISK